MRKKTITTILFFTVVNVISAQSNLIRKTDWTISEVKEWAERNKEFPTWHGMLLYQGSDTLNHHYISRVMDEWVWFNIKRVDLKITDERQYSKSSSAPFGYYYVDVTKNFIKTKDF
jgi:hypothetical protein